MYYYELIPADKSYHGIEALTYASDKKLSVGQVVKVKLRSKLCNAIVIREAGKPSFKTSLVEDVFEGLVIPRPQLRLLKWMAAYYPGPFGPAAQLFAPSFLQESEPKRSGDIRGSEKLPPLNDEQRKAFKTISLREDGTSVVHGITGSGKTRLYIRLAADSLLKNRSVIVLTPEISLTAPIAAQFIGTFGESVHINHSSLTTKQRLLLWNKAFLGREPMIIIGPRSSLFLPLKDIGLIVVDEFHEPAYKQESLPYYHANRVASMLSTLSSSKLIFGSATPPISDYYLAKHKGVPIIKLEFSALTGKKPITRSIAVNLLDPAENSGYPLISKTLVSEISEALKRGEQSMLFINKRGSARSISCQACGHRELCKNCDLPMIYHGDQHLIRCHICGSTRQPPAKCASCGSADIFFSSPGTKAIAENLSKLFPKAKVARFDRDNKKSERMENKYSEAMNEVDIIVGTQTIAKGHDLPRLSLAAMLLAENSLDFPDYSSEERSYQMTKQLAGRVNRGHREGIFIIQTFSPDSTLIKDSLQDSWEDFYSYQIKQRQQHGFPPFYSALKIESARRNRKSAENSLHKLIEKLFLADQNVELLGPAPSFVEKRSSKWHWQLIIKSKERSVLTKIASMIPSTFRVDIDPNNFL